MRFDRVLATLLAVLAATAAIGLLAVSYVLPWVSLAWLGALGLLAVTLAVGGTTDRWLPALLGGALLVAGGLGPNWGAMRMTHSCSLPADHAFADNLTAWLDVGGAAVVRLRLTAAPSCGPWWPPFDVAVVPVLVGCCLLALAVLGRPRSRFG